MSYVSVFILVLICILCVYSGVRKLMESKTEKDNEVKNQNIFSGVGLLFFGSVGLVLLLYVMLVY